MQWHGLLSVKAYQSEQYTRGTCFYMFIFSNKAYQSGRPARLPSTPGAGWPPCFYLYIYTLWSKLTNLESCQAALYSLSRMTSIFPSIYLYSLVQAYQSGRPARRPSTLGAGWPPCPPAAPSSGSCTCTPGAPTPGAGSSENQEYFMRDWEWLVEATPTFYAT